MALRVVTILVAMILLALAPAEAQLPTLAHIGGTSEAKTTCDGSNDLINMTAVEEYGKLLEQGRVSIDKKPNWEATSNLNESSDYVTLDGYYIAQFNIIRIAPNGGQVVTRNPFAYRTPDYVVIYNFGTKEQVELTWEQFQDAKKYEEYNRA